jgi:hypothetical protein
MFPLSAEKLPFLEIADFWSREIKPPASYNELLAILESAWWKGELKGNSALNRLQFLRKMFEIRREPDMQSVVFVTPNDAGPPKETPLAGGEFVVDVRPRIIVPGETDDWTEDSCKDAFEELSRLPSQEYFHPLSYGICFIDLTPEEFFGWVMKRGFEVPNFWKRFTEIGVTQATGQGSVTSNDLHIAADMSFGGRGTKRRAIQTAYNTLFPGGEIPAGMTSQERNDLILELLKNCKSNRPLPNKRTIERAIKDLILSRSAAKCRE